MSRIRSGGRRAVIRALVALIPVAIIVPLLYPSLSPGTAAPVAKAAEVQAIDVALNAYFCGKPRMVSAQYSVEAFLASRRDLAKEEFRDVIRAQAQGVGVYCQSVRTPLIPSQGTLMSLAQLGLLSNRHLTPHGLGWWLDLSRALILLVLGGALLRSSASEKFVPAAKALFASSSGGRPLGKTLWYFIPVALICLVSFRDVYLDSAPLSGNQHGMQSLDLALNARFCGQPGRLSMRFAPQVFLTTHPELMSQPFQMAIRAEVPSGTMEEYCQSLNAPIGLSENSLMWLLRFAMWVDPSLTPNVAGDVLAATRVLMLLVFGVALLRTGASPAFTVASLLVGCSILRHVGIRDTIYPFVLTLPLLHAGLYGIARMNGRLKTSLIAFCLFAAGMGFLMGFSASMRTVLLPIAVVMFALFVYASIADSRFRPHRRLAVPSAVAAFLAGYALYMATFIYPLQLPEEAGVPSAVYHTVSHQLVLGLAVPENDLSRREGIQWLDDAGFAIARRVDPNVRLFGKQYDAILFQYYRGLWRIQPGAMMSTYFTKLRSTGEEVFLAVAGIGEDFRIPRAPGEWLHRLTNGFFVLALAAATFGLAFWRHLRRHEGQMLIAAFVALSALAALAESFLTYSLFVGMYFSELLFFCFFVFLLIGQSVVDTVLVRHP